MFTASVYLTGFFLNVDRKLQSLAHEEGCDLPLQDPCSSSTQHIASLGQQNFGYPKDFHKPVEVRFWHAYYMSFAPSYLLPRSPSFLALERVDLTHEFELGI